MNTHDAYIITVHPEGAGPPATVRLRRGLKLLLRACGLRCTDIRQAADAKQPDTQQPQSPPIANAGHAVGDYTHEVAATVSEQGHEVGRGKLAMAGAGEQGRANNRTRQVLSGPAGEGIGSKLPAKPCERYLT